MKVKKSKSKLNAPIYLSKSQLNQVSHKCHRA